MLKKMGPIFAAMLAISALGSVAMADELDATPAAGLPRGLIVRTNADGSRDVFRAEGAKVSDANSAEAAINAFVKDSNKIANVRNAGELDHGSTTEAWYYVYSPTYGYAPYYYGYTPYGFGYYNPYYSYSYMGYPYTYYGYNPYYTPYYYPFM